MIEVNFVSFCVAKGGIGEGRLDLVLFEDFFEHFPL